MRFAIRRSATLLAAALAPLTPSMLAAQTPWFEPTRPEPAAGLEIFRPDFGGPADVGFATSVLFVTARSSIAGSLRFVGELPFAYASINGDSESTIGNPYIGVEAYRADGLVSLELGFRAPLALEDAQDARFVGTFTDLDRLEAFLLDVLAISLGVNYQARNAGGLSYRLSATPVVWLATGENDENELVVAYGGQLWHEGAQLRIGIGLAGRWLASTDGDDIGEKTLHQLGFGADFGAGQFRPGVHLRIPLDDDMQNIHDLVFGVGFQVASR